jgi:hypothetical protein
MPGNKEKQQPKVLTYIVAHNSTLIILSSMSFASYKLTIGPQR